MNGRLLYLSGGTTGKPKLRTYGGSDYRQSVQSKAEYLAHHGVNSAARVLVLHPFDPWSIGRVHCDAALQLGASVLPLGPRLGPFARIAREFSPTVICGAARVATRVFGDAVPGSIEVVVHAGEPLATAIRSECSSRLSCRVVDCYGMSEFDLVAGESNVIGELWLRPGLAFRLACNGEQKEPRPGLAGELLLSDEESQEQWKHTGDLASVIRYGECPIGDWGSRWVIRIDGRIDERYFLPDGSSIGSSDVIAIRERVRTIEEIQFVIDGASDPHPSLSILFTGNACPETVVHHLLECNLDLADAVGLGLIDRPRAARIRDDQLVMTERGKVVAIVIASESRTPATPP